MRAAAEAYVEIRRAVSLGRLDQPPVSRLTSRLAPGTRTGRVAAQSLSSIHTCMMQCLLANPYDDLAIKMPSEFSERRSLDANSRGMRGVGKLESKVFVQAVWRSSQHDLPVQSRRHSGPRNCKTGLLKMDDVLMKVLELMTIYYEAI